MLRPLITPLNLHQRLRKRIALTTLFGLLLLLLLLPTLLTQLIQYQLPRMGMGTVEIGNININLFRGKILLEEVALYKSAARVFSLEHAELDLSTLSLFERRLHIQSLAVKGLDVTIQQAQGHPLHIAGQAMPQPSAASATQSAGQESGWAFGIDAFSLTDSSLLVMHPLFSETIELDAITLGALATWRPDYITPLTLNVSLRDGAISLNAKSTPFSDSPSHQGMFSITSFPLDSLAALAKPALSVLSGLLTTQFNFELQQVGERLGLKQQGSLSLTELLLTSGTNRVSQQSLAWNGSIEQSDLARLDTLQVKGDLSLSGSRLMQANSTNDGIRLKGLAIKGGEIRGREEIKLAKITIDSLQADVIRAVDGVSLQGLPAPSAVSDRAKEAVSAEHEENPTKPFHFQIEQMKLSGENRLSFTDNSIKPTFSHSFILTEGEMRGLNSREPDTPMTVQLKGKDDFYSEFSVDGTMKPLADQQPSIDLKLSLNNFDMPPTSPYLVQLLGYRITTGQLNTDVSMAIEKKAMKGVVALNLTQAQLEPEDPARMESLQTKTTIPLNTALSLLRDRDDNIKLKLPIEGRLDDPQFDINDIINTALGNALKSASVSYLKYLLQPYGSLITIVKMAGDAAGSIQLEPVLFDQGSNKLSSEAETYMEKISTLLTQKSLNMKVCGYATTADLLILSKGKENAIPPAGHPQLEALAKQRAEGVKSLLVKQFGVSPKQLFVCHPGLDSAADAKQRVELSI